MTYKKTNLNDYIKVKLTEKGIDVVKQRYGSDRPIDFDDEGYTKFQMWDFARLFGKHMIMGLDLICCTDVMVQVEDDEWRYVKDGDLPKIHGWYWIQYNNGTFDCLIVTKNLRFLDHHNSDVSDCIYAWKEIVPPKE